MKIDTSLRKVTGIYKITNLITNDCYIGSSVDVYQRGCTYKHLIKRKKLHKHLQYSIEKYGYDNFCFELLERCDNSISLFDLHQLEQCYINKFIPKYNKRTVVDTNSLIEHSQFTKDKISKSLKELFNNGYRVVNRIQEHNIKVTLFTLTGGFINNFPGLSHCANFLNITSQSVKYALTSKRHVVKNCIVLKTEEIHRVTEFIGIPINTAPYSKKVKILNIVTNEILEFMTCKECGKFINCKVDTIVSNYKKNKMIKHRYKILEYG